LVLQKITAESTEKTLRTAEKNLSSTTRKKLFFRMMSKC
jgi:hypothetical protein